MLDPYRMVTVNIIASVFLIAAFLFYKYVYPKKTPPYLLIIFLLSLLPLISILRKGSYESGDLSLHATRAISFYEVLLKEHVIPTWSPELNIGYGDTYFEFIYKLPYIIISLFHALGLSFIASVKLLLAVSFVSSGLMFYSFCKSKFSGFASFVGSVFYLFAPYHLIDMHFRVSIAETLSFFFIPSTFYLINKLSEKPSKLLVFIFSMNVAGFLLTHQVIFVSSMPFVFIYLLLNKNNHYKTTLRYFFTGLILGLLISAFHWIPILLESRFIYQSFFRGIISFTPLPTLLFSPWRYGFLFQGHYGELSLMIGYSHLLVVVLSIYLLFKGKIKKYKLLLYFLVVSFFLLFFMMLSVSKILWTTLPLLKDFQFTYRLLAMEAFFTSFIAVIAVSNLKRNYFWTVVCFFTVFLTILNWGNRKSLPNINDASLKTDLINGKSLTGTTEPTAPRWVDPVKVDFAKRPAGNLEIVQGKAETREIIRSPYRHTYLLNSRSLIKVRENTFYYPGWKLFIDNRPYPLTYTNIEAPGVIFFTLNEGLHKAELIYTDTPVRKAAKSISVISILIFLIYYFPYFINRLIKSKFFLQHTLSRRI